MLKNKKQFDIFIKNIILICIFVFFCFLFIIYFFNLKEKFTNNNSKNSGLKYSSYSNNDYNLGNSFRYLGLNNYRNCLKFFETAGTPTSTGTVTSVNSIHDTSKFGLRNNQACAISIYGYFFATVTGRWTFTFGTGNLSNDDLSVFWIGTAGQDLSLFKSNVTESNYSFGVTYPVSFKNCSYSTSLIAGNYYPILLNWGQSWGGSILGFGITPPNGSLTYDGTRYFFTSIIKDNKQNIQKNINFSNCKNKKNYNGTINLNEIDNDEFTIDNVKHGFLGGEVNNTICNNYSLNNNEYIYNCKNDVNQDNCMGFFNYNNVIDNNSKIIVKNTIINNQIIDLNINNIQNNKWINNITDNYNFTYYKNDIPSTPTIETIKNVKSVKLFGNDYFRMDIGSSELVRSITYIIWINSNSINNSTIIYENGQLGFGGWCYPVIKITNSKLDSGIYPTTVPNNNPVDSSLSNNYWYQIALVYDDVNHYCIIYLNGKEVSSNYNIRRAYPYNNEIFLMIGSNSKNPGGCWNTGSSNNFVGNINSFSAYNYPLTIDQIQKNYNTDILSLGIS